MAFFLPIYVGCVKTHRLHWRMVWRCLKGAGAEERGRTSCWFVHDQYYNQLTAKLCLLGVRDMNLHTRWGSKENCMGVLGSSATRTSPQGWWEHFV